jgi:hypothetical protein
MAKVVDNNGSFCYNVCIVNNKEQNMLTKTTLINITEQFSEFVNLCGQEEAEALMSAEGEEVEVLSEETDCFWNIRLQDGTEITGISWYHLEGFTYTTTTCTVVELVD